MIRTNYKEVVIHYDTERDQTTNATTQAQSFTQYSLDTLQPQSATNGRRNILFYNDSPLSNYLRESKEQSDMQFNQRTSQQSSQSDEMIQVKQRVQGEPAVFGGSSGTQLSVSNRIGNARGQQESIGFESISLKTPLQTDMISQAVQEYDVTMSFCHDESAENQSGYQDVFKQESMLLEDKQQLQQQLSQEQQPIQQQQSLQQFQKQVSSVNSNDAWNSSHMRSFDTKMKKEQVLSLQEELLMLRKNTQEAAEFYSRQVADLQRQIEQMHEKNRIQSLTIKEHCVEEERLQMVLQSQQSESLSQLDKLIQKIRSIDMHTEQIFAQKLESERFEKQELFERCIASEQQIEEMKENLKQYEAKIFGIGVERENEREQHNQMLRAQLNEIGQSIAAEKQMNQKQMDKLTKELNEQINAGKVLVVREQQMSRKLEESLEQIRRLQMELERNKNGIPLFEDRIKQQQIQKEQIQRENEGLREKVVELSRLYQGKLSDERVERDRQKQQELQHNKNEEEVCRNLLLEFGERDSRIRELEESLQEMSQGLMASQAKIQQMAQMQEASNKIIESAQQQLESDGAKAKYYQSALMKADEIVNAQEMRIQQLEIEVEVRQEKQEAVISQLKVELENVCGLLKAATSEATSLKVKIKRVESENLSELAQLKAQLDQGYANLVQKQQQIEKSSEGQENRAAQENEVFALKRKVRELEGMITKSAVDNQTLTQNLANKNAQIQQLFDRLKQQHVPLANTQH